MTLRIVITLFLVLLLTPVVNAEETDYLSLLAEESEIKAIAVVSNVLKMSRNADGTFTRVTFKRLYALTPYTPDSFVGACKVIENGWQKRNAGTIYFLPKQGQRVYVTITTNGGAITSYTPINPELDHAVREEPYRLTYKKGKASVIPIDN